MRTHLGMDFSSRNKNILLFLVTGGTFLRGISLLFLGRRQEGKEPFLYLQFLTFNSKKSVCPNDIFWDGVC